MKKIIAIAGATLLATVGIVGPVQAGNLTKDACEAQGGTWSNDRGTKTCASSFEYEAAPGENPSGGQGGNNPDKTFKVKGQRSESQKGTIGAPGTSETYEESTEVTECLNPNDNQVNLDNPNCALP